MNLIDPSADSEFSANEAVLAAGLELAKDLLRKQVRQLTNLACRLQELIEGLDE
jgi:hypothetical protein